MWFKVLGFPGLTYKDTNGNTLRHDTDNDSVKFNSDTMAVYGSAQEAIDALEMVVRQLGVIELA
jgi:hypothetical protein